MGFAEDSRKIERIAKGSAEGLEQMYHKRLEVPARLLVCRSYTIRLYLVYVVLRARWSCMLIMSDS